MRFVFDEFDEKGDGGVGYGDPEDGGVVGDVIVFQFAIAGFHLKPPELVEDPVCGEVCIDGGEPSGIFAADECLPGELEHTAFEA